MSLLLHLCIPTYADKPPLAMSSRLVDVSFADKLALADYMDSIRRRPAAHNNKGSAVRLS